MLLASFKILIGRETFSLFNFLVVTLIFILLLTFSVGEYLYFYFFFRSFFDPYPYYYPRLGLPARTSSGRSLFFVLHNVSVFAFIIVDYLAGWA